jgi:hypothetical protein
MSVPLSDVHLLRFPVAVRAAAAEHHEELLREFSYLANPHPEVRSAPPTRLLVLVQDLRERYGAFAESPGTQIEAAIAAGVPSIDLVYQLPAQAADAARELGGLLDEVDEHCRRGDLLTLATPPLLIEFRRWFLGEIVGQLEGGEPTSWPGPLTPE